MCRYAENLCRYAARKADSKAWGWAGRQGLSPAGCGVTFGSSSSPCTAARRCRGAAPRTRAARRPQEQEQGSAGPGHPGELHTRGGGERVSREQQGGETAAARLARRAGAAQGGEEPEGQHPAGGASDMGHQDVHRETAVSQSKVPTRSGSESFQRTACPSASRQGTLV
jgi:hypothetical protein